MGFEGNTRLKRVERRRRRRKGRRDMIGVWEGGREKRAKQDEGCRGRMIGMRWRGERE